MKIVVTTPIEESVPPKKYGGTELMASHITQHLVAFGHEVYLLASGDSVTTARLIPIVPQSLRSAHAPDQIDQWREYEKMAAIGRQLDHIQQLQPDIVLNHAAWRFLLFSKNVHCPILSTMHGPLTSLTERRTYQSFKDGNYISISNNQRKALPHINWVDTIYNGIDVDSFPFSAQQSRDSFVFLGRTSPEKGLKEICTMIKKTPHRLKIAAKVDTADKDYFEQEIQPRIDGEQIEFLGEVDHEGKTKLLTQAKGLLLWLNWEEPFGLVVVEAMACGAPVIVNRRGSMPELILDGQTGYLINTIDEMQAALDTIDGIAPQDCRTHVEKHFSAEKMARRYETVATRILSREE